MSEVVMSVMPAGGGWWVNCDLPLEPTYYLSGARAEQTARNLAVRLTEAGRDVRLFVKDRQEQTIATHRYFSL
jgi:hypothetical protein